MSTRQAHRSRGPLATTYARHGEKLRFLLIGGWNTLFSIGVLWVLDRFIPYAQDSLLEKELVLAVSWVISLTQNFFTFKFLVFRSTGSWRREYLRMYVTYGATFVVQSAMMLAISHALGWTVFWSNLPTIVVVTVISYFGHKYFTFSRPSAGEQGFIDDIDGPIVSADSRGER